MARLGVEDDGWQCPALAMAVGCCGLVEDYGVLRLGVLRRAVPQCRSARTQCGAERTRRDPKPIKRLIEDTVPNLKIQQPLCSTAFWTPMFLQQNLW